MERYLKQIHVGDDDAMILTNGLKRVCDISFYMTYGTLVAWMFGGGNEPGLVITLPIFMLSAFLASFLAEKYGTARFLAILPLFTVFLVVPLTTINLLVLVSAIAIMIVNLPKPDERGSKVEYQKVFQLFGKIFVIMVVTFILITVVTMTAGNFSAEVAVLWIDFTNEVLIFGLAFIISSIIYLRMIRHDVTILKQTRFKIMNTVPLIGVGVAALVVSNPRTLNLATRFIGGILYFFWSAIAWIFPWVAYYLAMPFRGVRGERPEVDHGYDDPYMERVGMSVCILDDYGNYYCPEPPPAIEVNNALLIIIGLLLIVGLFILYKVLTQKNAIVVPFDEGVEEELIKLSDDTRKRTRRNENQVRAVYKKFLKLLKRNNFPTPLSATSLEMEKIAATKANKNELSELRVEYVRVRYGESDYSKADVTRVKGLYKKIKEGIER